MSIKIWAAVYGTMDYWVSEDGEVKSTRFGKERLLAQCEDARGYLLVGIPINGKSTTQKVHRLVACAFLANPFNKPAVNHKDGNKQNNNRDNLEWVTNKENTHHGIKAGLISGIRGEANPKAKLSKKDIDVIRKGYDVVNRRYNKSMALKYNVTWHTIRNITRGNMWSTEKK